jgi:hypothetical protein
VRNTAGGTNAQQRVESIGMTDNAAIEKRKLDIAEGRLYLGATLKDADSDFPADRMLVEHFTGNEDNVLIFKRNGKRHVGQIIQTMGIRSATPAVDASATIYEHVEEVDEDDRKRLLAMDDTFEKRTQR